MTNCPPEYPWLSRRNGEQGVVRLVVRVAADGRVLAVEVAQSSGFRALDEAARAAMRSKVESAVEATNWVAPASFARSIEARSRMLQATLAWIVVSGNRAWTSRMASGDFMMKPSTPHAA